MQTLKLNDWDDSKETMEEHLLRVAAAYISSHGREALILFGHPEEKDTMSTFDFCDYLINHANSMRDERLREAEKEEKNPSMEFYGEIIQAGGDKEATVTISATKDQLQRQPSIPFYLQSKIKITPT